MRKLTVMVSVYAAGDWLENRLDNLCHSGSRKDMDIWVLNANSPDPRDDEIPQKFTGPGFHYDKLPERIGVYAAWNWIIRNSNSQYLTNANADDLVAPACYQKLMGALDRHPKSSFAYPSWYVTDHPNLRWHQVTGRDGLTEAGPGGQPGQYAGDLGVAGVGHFPLWRRELHSKYGQFDERFRALGDADWWARCYYLGGAKFEWVSEYLACYLWRQGQNLWHQCINQDEWDLYHRRAGEYKLGVM